MTLSIVYLDIPKTSVQISQQRLSNNLSCHGVIRQTDTHQKRDTEEQRGSFHNKSKHRVLQSYTVSGPMLINVFTNDFESEVCHKIATLASRFVTMTQNYPVGCKPHHTIKSTNIISAGEIVSHSDANWDKKKIQIHIYTDEI